MRCFGSAISGRPRRRVGRLCRRCSRPAPAQPLPWRCNRLSQNTRGGSPSFARQLLDHVRPDVPWLVPDLSDLCAAKSLVSATAIVGDREIAIEEAVDLTALELLDLQRRIHGDWSALTWLCWCVGLAAVTMPAWVTAPADFGKAYAMLTNRAHDHVHVDTAAMMRCLTDTAARSPWQEDLRES